MPIVKNSSKQQDRKEALQGALVMTGVVVVGGLLLRRKIKTNTLKLVKYAAETAVSDWVRDLEGNGMKVLILSDSLFDQVTKDGLKLAAS